MSETSAQILEGVFAVVKPSSISSAQVLLDLQSVFSKSTTFAPLLEDTSRKRQEQEAHQPKGQKRKNEEEDGRLFKMGHGGTLDPLASGVLVVGIGRGTKMLNSYIGSTKTYETVVLFGKSTDTYDMDGRVVREAEFGHITREMVERELGSFRGTFRQVPPVYSALKIDGLKAHEYARSGRELPRELASREVEVRECTLLDWCAGGQHEFRWPGCEAAAPAPAATVRLTVSSGFYVRSFAHDLGVACRSYGLMASLVRSRQAMYTAVQDADSPDCAGLVPAIAFAEFAAGEEVWGPKLAAQLSRWVAENQVPGNRHVDGRDPATVRSKQENGSRQRVRGEWMADTKKERIAQQGGKFKGKWNLRKHENREDPNSINERVST